MENKKKPWVKPELKPLERNIQTGTSTVNTREFNEYFPTPS